MRGTIYGLITLCALTFMGCKVAEVAVDGNSTDNTTNPSGPTTTANSCVCPTSPKSAFEPCELKYFRDRVWPILKTKCAACHQKGQIGELQGARWHLEMEGADTDAGLEYNFLQVKKVASATGVDVDGNVNAMLVLKPTGLFEPEPGKSAHIGGVPIPPDDTTNRQPLDTLAAWALQEGSDIVLCDAGACKESTTPGVCESELKEDDSLKKQDGSRDERLVRRLSDFEYSQVLTDLIHPTGSPACTSANAATTCLQSIGGNISVGEVCSLGQCVVEVSGTFPKDSDVHGFRNAASKLTITADRAFSYLDTSAAIAQYIVNTADLSKYYAASCTSGVAADNEVCAKVFIKKIGQKIYRRKLLESSDRNEVSLYYTKYENDTSLAQEGKTFAEKMQGVIQIMLNSPLFLFRTEVGTKDEGLSAAATSATQEQQVFLLSEAEIASSIAFLVTGRGPDDALIEAFEADNIDLRDSKVIASHVQRLASSGHFRGFSAGFFHDWLGLNRVHLANPKTTDTSASSEQANALFKSGQEGQQTRTDIVQDALSFASERVKDGSFHDLMTSNAAQLTANTAKLYGQAEGATSLDEKRKGLLTRLAVPVGYALHDGPSPIFRGKFVRERFFCFEPAPPPPGVPIELQDLDATKVTTTRERFKLHREGSTSCFSCHQYMDPIGNTLGQYDQFGMFGTKELISKETIDPSGSVEVTCEAASDPTGNDCQLSGVDDLSHYLAQEPKVRKCVAEQLAGYAFGEYGTRSIHEIADAMLPSFTPTTPLKDVLSGLTTSARFTQRAKIRVIQTQANLDPCAGQCEVATQTCNSTTKQCEAKAECGLDAECKDASKPKCVAGQCREATSCVTDADCAGKTPSCGSTGKCEEKAGVFDVETQPIALVHDCKQCVGKKAGVVVLQTDVACRQACITQGGCAELSVCELNECIPVASVKACLSDQSNIPDLWCLQQQFWSSSCPSGCREYASDAERIAAQEEKEKEKGLCSICQTGTNTSVTDADCQRQCEYFLSIGSETKAGAACRKVDSGWGCTYKAQ